MGLTNEVPHPLSEADTNPKATFGNSHHQAVIGSDTEAGHVTIDPTTRKPTYHTTDGKYVLPNDSYEQDRLGDQAAALAEMMHGKVFHAPLKYPSRIVDIGCGTGMETCQLATAYPDAKVYGVDISAVPERTKPSNIEFLQGDIRKLMNEDPSLQSNSLDYVFSRLLVFGMTDWQGYINDVASLLKPGAYTEMQDLELKVYLYGTLCSDTWPWMVALRKQAAEKGWDFDCGRNIKKYMEKAGLVVVEQKRYRLPLGTWMVEEKPETKRIGEHAAREYGMLFHHAIPKALQGAGYSDEEINGFQEQCKASDRGLGAQGGKESSFFVTVGMKPEE
ncbi:MAG: hypothetical protein Q9166_008213 [cf. Caloplaca sp. 2 TL-2023]